MFGAGLVQGGASRWVCETGATPTRDPTSYKVTPPLMTSLVDVKSGVHCTEIIHHSETLYVERSKKDDSVSGDTKSTVYRDPTVVVAVS